MTTTVQPGREAAGPHRPAATFAALALALGALASVVGEAVAAAGWARPGYSYVNGYISDLASRDCGPYDGRRVCSPRWPVVDIAWVAEGLLVGVAGLLLAAALTRRPRRVVSALSIALAVGFILFAVFPKSASTEADGTLGLYWAGAVLVLGAGNGVAVALGLQWRRLRVSRAAGLAGIVLGAAGLLAVAVTAGWLAIGVAERISTYSFLLWQLVLAVALVRRPARR